MLQVQRIPLHPRADLRGSVTELYRETWVAAEEASMVQWNLVQSHGNVMRGVHVHLHHFDNLTVLQGEMYLGLCDLRSESPHYGQGSLQKICSSEPALWVIPPGVAHGFYFESPCVVTYGLSDYWGPATDFLGCQWNDPQLNIPWPVQCVSPILSVRDQNAPSLTVLLKEIVSEKGKS